MIKNLKALFPSILGLMLGGCLATAWAQSPGSPAGAARAEPAAVGCAHPCANKVAIGGAEPRPDSGLFCDPDAPSVESRSLLDATAEPAADKCAFIRSELGAFGDSQHGPLAAT